MKTQFLFIIIIGITFIQCQKSLNSTVEYVDGSYFQDFNDTFSFEKVLKADNFDVPNIMLPVNGYEAYFHDDTLSFNVYEPMCRGLLLKATIIKDKFYFQLGNSPYISTESLPIIKQSLKIENKPYVNGEKIKVEFDGEFLPYDYENSTLEKICVKGQLELTLFEYSNILEM